MRKIAIALSKGGVGKTTTAVNLAHGLAQLGRRVLIIDADTQGQAAKFLGVNPDYGLAEVVSGEASLEDALFQARPSLWLLAGGRSLTRVRTMIDQKDFAREKTLTEALAPLEGKYDFVIVDTAPGWDALTVNVLFYASEVLIPASLEAATLQGISEFRQNLQAMQKHHPDLVLRYVVPTMMDRRVRKSAEIMEILEKHYPTELTKPIRNNVRVSEAAGFGQTVYEYDAESYGAYDYAALTNHVEQHG